MSQKIQPEVEETETTPAKGAAAPGAGVSVAPSPARPTAQQAPGAAPAVEEAAPEPEVDRRKTGDDFNGVDKRKNVVDRRTGLDRRVLEIGSPTGLERRRGPGRRRSDDRRSAEEGEMSDEQFEFVMAVDTYKRLNKRPFPTWTEVLEVVKQLGYRKVAASTIKLPNDNGRSSRS
jgi:hypothetical protein